MPARKSRVAWEKPKDGAPPKPAARASVADYLVFLIDEEGRVTHCHRIAAGSNYAIVRKAASLYRSRPAVEIHFADRLIARLSAEEMAAIDAQQSPSKFVQSRGQIA
jgi:hypothetical protein